MIDVIWLSYKKETPARDYWDQALLEDIFSNKFFNTGYEFNHHEEFVETEGAVIVFPARAQLDCVDKLNKDLNKLKWAVLFIIGDEEALFDVNAIDHKNIKIYVMSPRLKHKKYRKFPNGYTPHTKDIKFKNKDLDWFFSGQVTHIRREKCVDAIRDLPNGYMFESKSFTAGLEREDYIDKMSNSKICPCPSGPETPDTFRLYEALECGCIPIADEQTPKNNFKQGYFEYLFGRSIPFPVLRNYNSLVGYTKEALENWKSLSNKVFSWWIEYKRDLINQISDDIFEVSNIDRNNSNITIIIPTNPIPSHPSTEVIEETIKSVRKNLPNSEIIITFDYPRENLMHRIEDYEEYIRRVLYKANNEWKNVLPIIFEEHSHQVLMTKKALQKTRTPLILFVEHDAPPVSDEKIEWEGLEKIVLDGYANVIRFHHEASILPEHEYLMFDHEDQIVCGIPIRRTKQWSQRPHLASTSFYKNMLDRFFTNQKVMIEDTIHGKLIEDSNNLMDWFYWRVWIYTPKGNNIKRSYHIDGRKNDPKY